MKRNARISIISVLILMIVISLAGWIYYNHTLQKNGLENTTNMKSYEKHYVLLVDSPGSSFWQSAYESASAAAAEENAFLELMGPDNQSDYTIEDMMRISIAESVDGILLEYTGGQQLIDLIDKAVGLGIPVVTISEDAPQSRRQSFVGVNTYQLGEAYSQQVTSLIKTDTRRVMVLTNSSSEESMQKLISVQISNAITKKQRSGNKVQVEVKQVNAQSAFDSEETIRNVFLTEEGPPDILVCMDEVDTECAYQAVIDYNEVGAVSVIGYYSTSMILEGITKNIIPMTIELDAQQMGEFGIDALTKYCQEGRVSDYYSVDVNIITPENVGEYTKEDEKNAGM